jgi:hypothetical protein
MKSEELSSLRGPLDIMFARTLDHLAYFRAIFLNLYCARRRFLLSRMQKASRAPSLVQA